MHGGGYAPATTISYDALHPESFSHRNQTVNDKKSLGTSEYTLYSLGPGKPYVLVSITDDPNRYHPDAYARAQIEIWVFGGQYSNYNMVQTVWYDADPPKLDKGWDWNNGFYYDDFELNLYSDPYYRKGSDFYFEDSPNAYTFKGEITLFGEGNLGWEVIQNMSWEYSVFDSNHSFNPFNNNPSEDHQSNIKKTLKLWNNP